MRDHPRGAAAPAAEAGGEVRGGEVVRARRQGQARRDAAGVRGTGGEGGDWALSIARGSMGFLPGPFLW